VGFLVNDRLVEYFSGIVNVGFTAEMEEKLDRVATGEQAWVPMLHDFYGRFSEAVRVAEEKMPRIEYKPEPTGELCPECGRPLLWRQGRYGKFIGCSGWPECRYSAPIPLPGVSCPECGGDIVEKRTRRGRRFWGCANYRPDDETACQWASWKKPEAPEASRVEEGGSGR
jgi:DNA topoisomerase-1